MSARNNDNASLRIIDANLNRAREALRVMEDFARLVLDDAGLSSEMKHARHALAEVCSVFEKRSDAKPGLLISARDIVHDVGCDVATPSEPARRDNLDVAIAAGKRLSEAFRAIEEYGKTLDATFAAAIEKLRYRGYEIERRLAMTVRAKANFGQVRLYVILTEALCVGDWFTTAEATLRRGADCLQLREKDLPDRELLVRAKRLATLCREHEALLIVNDRPDIATASGAHGVHLGQDDLSVSAARRVLPPSAIVGVSTHTVDQIASAAANAPDYIAVGPMFVTPTKPQPHVAGPDTLAAAGNRTSLPLVAIGGITVDNADELLAGGPCALCVCRGIIEHRDVESATRRLRTHIDQAIQDVGG